MGRRIVFALVLLFGAAASASLVMPEQKGLPQLVKISPVIVLARPSKQAPRVRKYPIKGAPAGTEPSVRTSAAYDVLRVLRGPVALAAQTLYIDPPNWELFRRMGEASVRNEPVPSPILPQYVPDPKLKPAPGPEVILFLRPGQDGAYDETMMDGRETQAALQRVIDAIKAAPAP